MGAPTVVNETARKLRNNQTDAERKLWSQLRHLKNEGFHFRRQAPIGPYIADFVCHKAKLVIEADGDQHGRDEDKASDQRRTTWLNSQGYDVQRYWNHEILNNLEGVVIAIRGRLGLN